MTIEQLREQVRREDDRVQAARDGGHYISPPPLTHVQDKERLQKMEEDKIQRQAALQDVPHERTQQVQQVRVEEAQTVESSTSSAEQDSGEQEEPEGSPGQDSDNDYWNNILRIVNQYWLDGEGLAVHKELHEGMLYYMEEDDIEKLIKRAQRDKEEDAVQELETYQKDMEKLDERLWRQLSGA
eukprot:6490294-Amphidinium_carterae.5